MILTLKTMKRDICIAIALFLFWGSLYGQYKSITVPAGTKIIESFPPSVRYMYPQFIEGDVILNNGLSSSCMINYNMLHDDMEFIQDNDTVTIVKKKELKYVTVDSDTFIFMPGYMKNVPGYMKLIYGQKLKIYCKDKINLKDILKRGAMGSVNRTAAIGSFSDFEATGIPYDLIVPEDYVFKREITYYIATSSGTFEPFKKKNVLKLFSFHKAEVQKYLKTNKVNFEKQEDVIKFAEYLSTL